MINKPIGKMGETQGNTYYKQKIYVIIKLMKSGSDHLLIREMYTSRS